MGIHDKNLWFTSQNYEVIEKIIFSQLFFLPAKTIIWLAILPTTLILHISVVLEGTHPVNELYCVSIDKTCLELYWSKQAMRVTI